jgi:hypothetical protein
MDDARHGLNDQPGLPDGDDDFNVAAGDQARPRRRRNILIVMALVAAAGVAWALLSNWRKVSSYNWHLSPAWLIAGTVAMLASYQLNGMTYVRSVELLSPSHPPRPVAVSIWARSLLARYIPGSVMLFVGRAMMGAAWGVPKKTTVAAMIYEQLIGLGLGAAATVAYVGIYGSGGNRQLMWVLIIIPIGLVALHPRIFVPLSSRILRLAGRPPLEQTFSGRQILALLGGYTGGAVLVCLGVWALVRAAAGPAIGGPLEISLAFLLAFAVSTVAFIFPSGLGVRDGILAVLFARNLGGGSTGPALAIAVGLRFAIVVIELIYVGLATLAGRRR